jgi:hypothetical protein
MEKITLKMVRDRQPEWFSLRNKRFFGDVSYQILFGKATGRPYLVRSTYGWSDMFGQPKRLTWRIDTLGDDLAIKGLVDDIFKDIQAVKDYLKTR